MLRRQSAREIILCLDNDAAGLRATLAPSSITLGGMLRDKILDEATLRCAYDDGVEPYALHHVARKPWLAATRWNVYSRLVARR